MRFLTRVVVCGLAVFALSNVTRAQETRGSIEGVVKDTSGAVLPGVSVEARSPSLVGVSTAITVYVKQNAASAVLTAEVINRIPKGRGFSTVLVQAQAPAGRRGPATFQIDGS